MRLVLEQAVLCPDGRFGALADLIIDPASRRLTHLVVLPDGRRTGARLVALAHVDTATASEIVLRCNREAVDAMDAIDEVAFVRAHDMPVDEPDWDVGVSDMQLLPSSDALEGIGPVQFEPDPQVMLDYHRIPKGDVEIRRASPVTSSDGHHVGHLDGFVIEDGGAIAGILVVRGHLWGRRRVTIPVDAVAVVDNDRVELRVAEHDLGALSLHREP